MRNNRKLFSIILAFVLISIPSCGGDADEDPIRLGIILELTGVGAFYGESAQESIELALEQVNYEVAGRTIEVIWEDNASDPATAIEKARKLVEQDNVDLLVGPIFGDAQDALGPYLKEQGIMNAAILGLDWSMREYGNWIGYPGSLTSFGIPLGDFAYEQGYRTMVTVGADYIAGYELVRPPAERFVELGGEWVEEYWVPFGTEDYGPTIAAIEEADVVLIWTILPDTIAFIRQYREFGIETPLLINQFDFLSPEILEDLGESALGIRGMISMYTGQLDFPENETFVADLREKTGREAWMADGAAYSVMQAILAGLEATDGDPSLDKLRPAILELDLRTPSGPLSFTENGFGITNRYVAEVRQVDGRYVLAPFKTYENVIDPRE